MLGAAGSAAAGGYVVVGRFKIVDDDAEDAEPDAERQDAEQRGGHDSGSSTESEYYEDADYDDLPALALIADRIKRGLSALPDDDDSDSSESDDDLFLTQMVAKKKSDDEATVLFGSSDSDDADEEYGSKSDGSSDQDDNDDGKSTGSVDEDASETKIQEQLSNASGVVDAVEIGSVVMDQTLPRHQADQPVSCQPKVLEPHTRSPLAADDFAIENCDRSDSDLLMDATTSMRQEDYDPDAVFGSSESEEEGHEGEQLQFDTHDQGHTAQDNTGEVCRETQTDGVQTLAESATTVEICSVVEELVQTEDPTSDLPEAMEDSVKQAAYAHRFVDRERSDSDITLFGSSIPREDYDPAEVFGSSDSDDDENSSFVCSQDAAENAQSCFSQTQTEHVQALSTLDEGRESCFAVTEEQTPFESISQDVIQELPASDDPLVLPEAKHSKPDYRCKTCPALLPPPMPDMIGFRQCACCECVYPSSQFDWARRRCKFCSPFVIWRCACCGLSLPKEAFSKAQRSRKNGSRCKKCVQASRYNSSAASATINTNDTKTNGYAGMSDAVLNRRLAEVLLGGTRSLKRKHKEGGLDALTTTEIETLNALSSELARRTAEVLMARSGGTKRRNTRR